MEQTSDGFLIAEKDLEIRGAGELLGTKQAGLPEFRIGNLFRDQQILEQARKEAEFFLTKRESSVETSRMIQQVKGDERFGFGSDWIIWEFIQDFACFVRRKVFQCPCVGSLAHLYFVTSQGLSDPLSLAT